MISKERNLCGELGEKIRENMNQQDMVMAVEASAKKGRVNT